MDHLKKRKSKSLIKVARETFGFLAVVARNVCSDVEFYHANPINTPEVNI